MLTPTVVIIILFYHFVNCSLLSVVVRSTYCMKEGILSWVLSLPWSISPHCFAVVCKAVLWKFASGWFISCDEWCDRKCGNSSSSEESRRSGGMFGAVIAAVCWNPDPWRARYAVPQLLHGCSKASSSSGRKAGSWLEDVGAYRSGCTDGEQSWHCIDSSCGRRTRQACHSAAVTWCRCGTPRQERWGYGFSCKIELNLCTGKPPHVDTA